MSAVSYEEGIKKVRYGFLLLGAITIIEVGIALVASHYEMNNNFLYSLIMIAFSVYKAYFIIYEFMHMGYEVKGLAMSVLLPMLLLVWGIIAFLNEGSYWGRSRKGIDAKNAKEVKAPVQKTMGDAKTLELNKVNG